MARRSLISELFAFVKARKAYVLVPVIATLLLAGVLIVIGSSKGAMFIYTLF